MTAWGSCPECAAAITAELAACKACGFPLKPKAVPAGPPGAAAPSPSKATTRTRKHRKPSRSPGAPGEPTEAMVFAVLGLFIPILAVFGLMQSRKGSGAYLLSWVGIGLWIVNALVILTLVARKVS